MLRIEREMKATRTLSILRQHRQRGVSIETAADTVGLYVERMRELIERRELRGFGVEELGDILDVIDASGPRMA